MSILMLLYLILWLKLKKQQLSVCVCVSQDLGMYFSSKTEAKHFIGAWNQQLQLMGTEENSSCSQQAVFPVGCHCYTCHEHCLN